MDATTDSAAVDEEFRAIDPTGDGIITYEEIRGQLIREQTELFRGVDVMVTDTSP